MSFRYLIHGLRVLSDMALPGCMESGNDDSAPELRIENGAVPGSLPGCKMGSFQREGDRILFQTRDSGKFLVEGRERIIVEKHPHATDADIAAMLTNVVFGVVLFLRGTLALHASAVEYGGKAILFCGNVGVGKSILAAAFLKKGARFISDDITCIVSDGDTFCAVPGPGSLVLWPDSLEALGDDAARYDRLRPALEKRLVPVENRACGKVPIGTVFFVSWSERGSAEKRCVEKLRPIQTAAKFDENTCFRARFVYDQPAFPFFTDVLQLTRQAQVFRLKREANRQGLDEDTAIALKCLHADRELK